MRHVFDEQTAHARMERRSTATPRRRNSYGYSARLRRTRSSYEEQYAQEY